MAPKTEIRNKLADALDVDLSALSDINIQTYEDIMHTLFCLKKNLIWILIEPKKKQLYLLIITTKKLPLSLLIFILGIAIKIYFFS